MPREAPVTRAMREARGRVIERTLSSSSLRKQGPIRRDGHDGGRYLSLVASEKRRPVVMGPCFRRGGKVSSPPPIATIAAAAARLGAGRANGSAMRRENTGWGNSDLRV